MNTDILYPNDDEAAVIGCCFDGNSEVISEAYAISPLIVSDLIRDTIQVLHELSEKRMPTDFMSLSSQWKKTFPGSEVPLDIWTRAMDLVPSSEHLPIHVSVIKEASERRKLREAGLRLAQDAINGEIKPTDAVSTLEGQLLVSASEQSDIVDAKTVVSNFIADTQERFNRKGQLSGVPTGFRMLDKMTDGIQLGELFLAAARPSVGKTALAISITEEACIKNNVPTLFITCEMSEKAIMRRLVSSVGSIPMQSIKTGQLNQHEMSKLMAATVKCSKAPLFFLDRSSGASISEITAVAKRSIRKNGIKLVVVDYLQKIAGQKSEKRTYEIADVSGKLKALAAKTKTAVLALAQLNRESEKEKGRPPRLADLADSGQIERDADTVVLINRDRSVAKGESMLIIAKQRDGECGIVNVGYDGEFCRFYDLPFDA
jgi:replicative DNA helicase